MMKLVTRDINLYTNSLKLCSDYSVFSLHTFSLRNLIIEFWVNYENIKTLFRNFAQKIIHTEFSSQQFSQNMINIVKIE